MKTNQGEICESCMNRNFQANDPDLIKFPHFSMFSLSAAKGVRGGCSVSWLLYAD